VSIRKSSAGALVALLCLLGFSATAAAAPGDHHRRVDPKSVVTGQDAPSYSGRKPTDHPKLDKKLNERAAKDGANRSRVIVVLKPGCSIDADLLDLGGKKGRSLGIISGHLAELPNGALRKLANNECVAAIHHDRKTGGEMNRAAVIEGARAVQAAFGYDGAGVGVAIIDSGVTTWHDDLTYQGSNPNVTVVNGQRVVTFVDFVNNYTTPYDDNGHGTHVAGIIAGNGYDTLGARAGMAPAADIISLKVLDDHGGGYISNVIAALDWVVANHDAYHIRVVNLSVGAAVTESYMTDPLTLAAKRVVDAGVVVVTAAGNLGKNYTTGTIQYGGITAPGNAPWVLTVGAYSHEGTITRVDDKVADFSSRGPTAKDYLAKPDVVATGVGTVSLSAPESLMFTTKAPFLLGGLLDPTAKPYLSLTGTSMAAPIVTGTVALMMQANPNLTPNLVKAIIEYTAQRYPGYNSLTQGAGFVNAKGAVQLARFYANAQTGDRYPSNPAWSHLVIWGNHKIKHGVLKPTGNAYTTGTVWGSLSDVDGDNIVWGSVCNASDVDCDNVVWGSSDTDGDNIVWGSDCQPDQDCDNIVWGSACASDANCDNVVWGSTCGGADCTFVWGTNADCPADQDCDNIVWGSSDTDGDNIVWGSSADCPVDQDCDNIVWGSSLEGEVDNVVWGSSSEPDNLTWGCAGEGTTVFDDPVTVSNFNDTDFDALLMEAYLAFHPGALVQTTVLDSPPPPPPAPPSDPPPPPPADPPPADPSTVPPVDPSALPPADPGALPPPPTTTGSGGGL
jgi:serine protease AprX